MNYCETLLLRSKRGRVSVILVGQGVSPALVMDPEDGQLPHMHICAGCTMTQTVKLSNTSIFPLPVRA